jgi:outer membrane protein OmpA-like peptidoglycan-associated protein
MEWQMILLWRVGTATIGFLGVLAVVGTAGLWGSFVAPAMAQKAGASPPEVSVDLDVLNSLDEGPTPSDGNIVLHPPREQEDVASEHESGPIASRKPGRRAKATTTTHAPTPNASTLSNDAADRAAGGQPVAESHRKPAETARLKREEAERLRQAKAEIEEAARRASPAQKTATAAGAIPSPGPGPMTPPPPNQSKPGSPPGPVASTTRPAGLATPPPAPPVEPKRAALVRSPVPAPHIDFAAGTADLTPAARSALDNIAKALASDDGRRVQLVAYATGTEDEANQARRISLSRALNVRAYLIDHGVRNTRMDVRALGNRPDGNKPADRVDIVFLDK